MVSLARQPKATRARVDRGRPFDSHAQERRPADSTGKHRSRRAATVCAGCPPVKSTRTRRSFGVVCTRCRCPDGLDRDEHEFILAVTVPILPDRFQTTLTSTPDAGVNHARPDNLVVLRTEAHDRPPSQVFLRPLQVLVDSSDRLLVFRRLTSCRDITNDRESSGLTVCLHGDGDNCCFHAVAFSRAAPPRRFIPFYQAVHRSRHRPSRRVMEVNHPAHRKRYSPSAQPVPTLTRLPVRSRIVSSSQGKRPAAAIEVPSMAPIFPGSTPPTRSPSQAASAFCRTADAPSSAAALSSATARCQNETGGTTSQTHQKDSALRFGATARRSRSGLGTTIARKGPRIVPGRRPKRGAPTPSSRSPVREGLSPRAAPPCALR